MKRLVVIIGVLVAVYNQTILYADQKYKYNYELTYEQALNIEPKEFFQKTNPKYILNAILLLIDKATYDEKSLKRLFILLPNCDAGYAEMIAQKLFSIMKSNESYFFEKIKKVDAKVQRRVLLDIILLPDNDFNINDFKRNEKNELLFTVYNEHMLRK